VNVDKTILFSSFTGSCAFTNVGAIVLTVAADNNVDSTLFFLKTSGTPPVASASPAPPPPAPSGTAAPSTHVGFTWYTFDEEREPCEQAVPRRPYFMNDDNIVYYYAYSGKTVPLDGASGGGANGGASGGASGASGAISGSSALVPSIFTVLVVLIFSFC